MAAKKVATLSKLSFKELHDKVKDVEGSSAMNRFEMTMAARQAENQPVCPDAEKCNPRQIKPEIKSLKSKLAETTDKKSRKEMRKSIGRLKKTARKYL